MIEYGKNYRYRDICAIFNWIPCSGSKQRSQINILKKDYEFTVKNGFYNFKKQYTEDEKNERLTFLLLDNAQQPFSKSKETATSILAKIKLFEEFGVVEKAKVKNMEIVCKACGEEYLNIELEGTMKMTFDCSKCGVRNVIFVDNMS